MFVYLYTPADFLFFSSGGLVICLGLTYASALQTLLMFQIMALAIQAVQAVRLG